jgi:hypothetical protein
MVTLCEIALQLCTAHLSINLNYKVFTSGAKIGGLSTFTAEAIILTFFNKSSSFSERVFPGKGILLLA